jgi:predicted CXXCH cytochrome family protein
LIKMQSTWKRSISIGILVASAGMAAIIMAEDKKEIPDHTGFQSCQPCHSENQSAWEASGHSKALSRVAQNSQASADCYGCHSAEGFAAKLQAQKVDTAQKESFHTVTCTACHKPQNTGNPRRLVLDPEKICSACHTQEAVIQGKGARGIEETRSFHSAIPCTSCHMTGGNHLMKVIRPDDPDLSEKRMDTCTSCHRDNNRKARAKQLQDWQSEYKKSIEPLQADIKTVGATLKEKPSLLSAELKTRFENAKANLSILERDRSHGAHNFDYAVEILALAARDLRDVKAAMQ